MTIISRSGKFEGNQFQSCVVAGGFLILRSILRKQDRAVMTATAGETKSMGSVHPFPDQAALIAAAEEIFHAVGGHVTKRKDRSGRPYVQTVFPDAWATLPNVAEQIASKLNLNLVEIVDDEFVARYWQENAQDPLNDDELVYLSDGVYVTKDGRLIEQ
jgi:hypothetical protein